MSAAARLHLADLHLQAGEEDRAAERLLELARAGRNRPRVLRSVARRIARLADASASVRVAEALRSEGRGPEKEVMPEVKHMPEDAPRPDAAPDDRRAALDRSRREADAHLDIEDVGAAWRLLRPHELEGEDLPRLQRIAHAFRRIGELTLAWEVLQRATLLAPGDAEIRRTEHEVAQEVRVLSGHWPSESETSSSLRTRPATVLYLTETSAPILWTRAALQVHMVAMAQQRAGFRVHVAGVLGIPDASQHGSPRRHDDVEYHHLRFPHPVPSGIHDRLTASLREATRLAQRVRPAVVHADAGYLTAMLGRTVARTLSVPVLQEFRPFPSIATSQRARWREECMTAALQAADAVVVRSQPIAEAARSRGVERRQLHVVPLPPLPRETDPGRASGRARGQPRRTAATAPGAPPGWEEVREAYARILDSLGARRTGRHSSRPSTHSERERAGPFAP